MAWDDYFLSDADYADYTAPVDSSYYTDDSSFLGDSSFVTPDFSSFGGFRADPYGLLNFDLGSGFNYSPEGLDYSALALPLSNDISTSLWSSPDMLGQALGVQELNTWEPQDLRMLGTPEARVAADNLEQAQIEQEQALSSLYDIDQLQQDVSGLSQPAWKQLLMPEYGSSNAAWAEDPRGTENIGKDFRASQSYIGPNGEIVGDASSGADIQNPYEYVQGEDGSTYIRNLNTGRDVGYLDENLQDQSYQDARLLNNADPSMLDQVRGAIGKFLGTGSSGQASRSGQTAQQGATQQAARAYQNAQAQQNSTSPAQGALAAAKMAGLLYQALKGRNNNPTKARSSSVSDIGPRQNASANRRTLYAKGGEIEGLPSDVRGGLLPVALQLAKHLQSQGSGKGFIDGVDGGQDDVVDIKAAPGEYVFDAEVVSALGDGNSKAGAAKLDKMRHNVRKHKRSGGLSSIPPKAKSPEQYMKGK